MAPQPGCCALILDDFGPSTPAEPLTEEEEYLRAEQKTNGKAFYRVEKRRRRLKALLDCGHWIDGTEPYRYAVWRDNFMPRGRIEQRTDCEPCARRYDKF